MVVLLCVFVDWLDDVELARVRSGGGRLRGFVRRLSADAHSQCSVGPDRQAGVSLTRKHAHKDRRHLNTGKNSDSLC